MKDILETLFETKLQDDRADCYWFLNSVQRTSQTSERLTENALTVICFILWMKQLKHQLLPNHDFHYVAGKNHSNFRSNLQISVFMSTCEHTQWYLKRFLKNLQSYDAAMPTASITANWVIKSQDSNSFTSIITVKETSTITSLSSFHQLTSIVHMLLYMFMISMRWTKKQSQKIMLVKNKTNNKLLTAEQQFVRESLTFRYFRVYMNRQ